MEILVLFNLMFNDMAKNNPFGLRYSKSCRYEGLDVRHQSHGLINFIDLRFAIKACLILVMQTYRRQGILNYDQIFKALYLSDPLNVGLFPLDVPETDSDFADLVYRIALSRSGIHKVSACHLNFDLCFSVLRSYNIQKYG